MKKRHIVIIYVIGIHMVLGFVLLKSDFILKVQNKLGIVSSQKVVNDEITGHYHQMIVYHELMDGNVPLHSVIFIGDSITQGLAVSSVFTPSVNYGIGNDTSVGVLQRLPIYNSINNAIAVIIAIGINDMLLRSNNELLINFKAIANQIPKDIPTIFSAILPIDESARRDLLGASNHRIKEFNSKLEKWTEVSANLFFVDAGSKLIDREGNLSEEFHLGDGVHLNSRGYSIWIEQLRLTITKVQQDV